MSKFIVVVISLSLLASVAFAQGEAKRAMRIEILSGGKTIMVVLTSEGELSADKIERRSDGTVTIELAKSNFRISATKVHYSNNGAITLTGKVSIVAEQGKRQLMKITTDEAIIEIEQTEKK